jgi:hypothetical protein
MPMIKNNSSRVIHVDGIIIPGETVEISQERLDSQPVQNLLDDHELVEEAPKPKAKVAAPAPTLEQTEAKK